ncbi:MAG TPA: UDP-N-acetylenolpyruvoylglucosamine reductase, partial [Patescibacteria group bacterium]|nr:UDP-N-acetylenolpyruvoylglucosamine reductase [Patescibacteria group bacterium]
LPNWREGLRDGYISAGFIIDRGLGLKGYRLGNMQISDLHANFFINLGGASAKNAKELIDFVKNKCQNTFDISLEEEIKYTGKF